MCVCVWCGGEGFVFIVCLHVFMIKNLLRSVFLKITNYSDMLFW